MNPLALVAGWKGYAAILVLGLALGAAPTWRVMQWRADSAKVAPLKQAVKTSEANRHQEAKAEAISFDIGAKAAAEHVRIEVQTRTVIQKVPVYVTPAADVRYAIPWGLVRVHDAALTGRDPAEVPIPAGAADDAPSAVTASALAANDAANFGQCRQAYDIVTGWQEWATAQKALSDRAAAP